MVNKLLVASEFTDPTFYTPTIKQRLKQESDLGNKCGLLLITKDISCCREIWEHCDAFDFPIIVHATITGLGDTSLEPHAPSYKMSLISLRMLAYDFRDRLNQIVLRIDPLIPNVTNYSIIEEIIKTASTTGITRCRTSVLDYYPFVRDKLKKAGYPTYETFQAPREVIKEHLGKVFKLCEENGLQLELCAERFEGATHKGCAHRYEWRDLGLELPHNRFRQRYECFCNVIKNDILKGENCHHGCLYCYWGKYR